MIATYENRIDSVHGLNVGTLHNSPANFPPSSKMLTHSASVRLGIYAEWFFAWSVFLIIVKNIYGSQEHSYVGQC